MPRTSRRSINKKLAARKGNKKNPKLDREVLQFRCKRAKVNLKIARMKDRVEYIAEPLKDNELVILIEDKKTGTVEYVDRKCNRCHAPAEKKMTMSTDPNYVEYVCTPCAHDERPTKKTSWPAKEAKPLTRKLVVTDDMAREVTRQIHEANAA